LDYGCKKVVVIGGGVAGMSAAHELVERGFDVEVLERNPDYVGGKARSVNVPGSNHIDPARYLPGEHGFRFSRGFMPTSPTPCGAFPPTEARCLTTW